ncbi:hypothetical protein PT520_09545 [Aliarcobacter butzleri]|uniref:J domain-containing protein n=1 Tax=Aliarcobacter butzleri TaxID=28197 RepID=A0AAW6VQS0_9BACT|nr:hypothetical protein [Aliarcobacter butzleri]MDK2062759.1 hypothetical protein [Aliarcobacter butzleri]
MERLEIEKLFKEVTELVEAKKLYKNLAKKLHPDVGGDEESFKALNAVYNHILEHGLFFSSETSFDLDIEKIISQVLHFENIEIEVVGKWIWISGDTRAIKETLKNLGFKWASKKMMWYYGELLKCKSRKEKSIEEIRLTYGSQKVATKKSEKIAA